MMTSDLEMFIKDLTVPKISWIQQLSRFMEEIYGNFDDYSWRKPSRRQPMEDFIMPCQDGKQLPPFVVALDTSGSMSQGELTNAISEFNSILEKFNSEAIFLCCDYSEIKSEERFTSDDVPFKPKVIGGGGTSFEPPFKWVDDNNIKPSFLIYFTDLYGSFPKTKPDYPVFWVTESKNMDVPFGTLLEM
jgi:predicted metal-dependent peptidase